MIRKRTRYTWDTPDDEELDDATSFTQPANADNSQDQKELGQ